MGTTSTSNKGKDPRSADSTSQRMNGIGNANNRPGTGSSKSTSTGTGGLSSAASQAFGDPRAYDKAMNNMTGMGGDKPSPNGKQTENGASSQSAPQKNLPTGVTPMSQPKPMGAVPFIGSPSLGQILGTTISALVPGGGLLNNAPDIARGKFSTQTSGGLLGEGIDSLTGQKPGPQTGWSADPSMTPGRDRAQRGTTSRESFDQTTLGSASSTASGDAAERPAARDAENFSDIQMADRRKPNLKQMLETMI